MKVLKKAVNVGALTPPRQVIFIRESELPTSDVVTLKDAFFGSSHDPFVEVQCEHGFITAMVSEHQESGWFMLTCTGGPRQTSKSVA